MALAVGVGVEVRVGVAVGVGIGVVVAVGVGLVASVARADHKVPRLRDRHVPVSFLQRLVHRHLAAMFRCGWRVGKDLERQARPNTSRCRRKYDVILCRTRIRAKMFANHACNMIDLFDNFAATG